MIRVRMSKVFHLFNFHFCYSSFEKGLSCACYYDLVDVTIFRNNIICPNNSENLIVEQKRFKFNTHVFFII